MNPTQVIALGFVCLVMPLVLACLDICERIEAALATVLEELDKKKEGE